MPQDKTAPPSNRTLPMSVANMTFMVDKLGEDCTPLQFVRELTQNAIQSVQKDPSGKREIRWDVAWHHHALTGTYKLAVIDTGVGMTGEEMVDLINRLSSSIEEQSRHGNFGVGAKIAALPRNPEGLLYLSWKEGVGYITHIWRDPDDGRYGAKAWQHKDGVLRGWNYIDDALKPTDPKSGKPLIGDHGTMVVLLGESEKHNTMQPPAGTPMPSRWVLRYLNTRYFAFPKGVIVKAPEGWEKGPKDSHSFVREVQGQQPWLDESAGAKGTVELTTANAHWWILKEDIDDDSGHNAGGGHVAALYQNELYEMVTGRAGMARLQGFGVIFGCNRVVLYVQPKKEEEPKVTANIARTNLIYNGEPLPWSEWAAEFRSKLPPEIEALQEEISAKSAPSDHRAAIRDRLSRIRELFHFRRYRPAKDGKHSIDDEATNPGGTAKAADNGSGGGGGRGGRGGRAGDVYSLFLAAQGGVSAEEVNSMIEPNVKWVTEVDGTRIPPLLEDRAASYLPDQNLLQINADFRVFMDMVERWSKKFSRVPGARPVVEQVTREWFEQQLIETVMGTLALRQTGQWTLPDLQKLWSEEALTAAVLPRFHVDVAINRGLSTRLGSLKEQVV